MSRKAYRKALHGRQRELNELAWTAYEQRRATVAVFEGMDAAGKSGAIRRIVHAVDARLVHTVGIGPPTDEEAAHHYLWRFWRHVPRAGYMTLFDRSWYGRVLVERVEGLTRPARWRAAYDEINAFEAQLADAGITIAKFWLQVDRDEQLARFRARARQRHKRYKITDDDWRNRGRWEDYRVAADDMIALTDSGHAPWTPVAGTDKRHARLAVLDGLTRAMRSTQG